MHLLYPQRQNVAAQVVEELKTVTYAEKITQIFFFGTSDLLIPKDKVLEPSAFACLPVHAVAAL